MDSDTQRPFVAIDPNDYDLLICELGAVRGASAVLLWVIMNELAFKAGCQAFPATYSKLQHRTGLSRQKVCEYLQELRRLGYLSSRKQCDKRGYRAANLYTMHRGLYVQSLQNELRVNQSPQTELRTVQSLQNEHKSRPLLQEDTRKPPISPNGGRFTAPTIDEVTDYCRERQNNVEPGRFIDYYESIGWKVGSKPMKDWRAAVRTWERQSKPANNPRPAKVVI